MFFRKHKLKRENADTCSECEKVFKNKNEPLVLNSNKSNNSKVLGVFTLFLGVISLILFRLVFVGIIFGIIGIILGILAIIEAKEVKVKYNSAIVGITLCCIGFIYSIRVFVFDVISFIATKK